MKFLPKFNFSKVIKKNRNFSLPSQFPCLIEDMKLPLRTLKQQKLQELSFLLQPPINPTFHWILDSGYQMRDISNVSFSQNISAAAAAKSLQLCPTLCDPIDGSPPGSSVPWILQARILEWVAISYFNVCMHAKSLQSCTTLQKD